MRAASQLRRATADADSFGTGAWQPPLGGHDVDLWLWAASAAVSVAFGLRFFGHYYMQLVPPLCLLTAGALARGPRRLVVATFALAALVGVSFSAAGYFMHPFGGAARYETVSRYLVAHAEPTDRVLVWGSMPEVYWASGRRPATRFVTTNTFLAGNHPGRPAADVEPQETDPAVWDWFFDDMSAHPPRFVLDTAPARIRGAEFTPIRDFPRLERLLRTNYRYVRSIDRIRIYERR